MLIGSGLLARVFSDTFSLRDDVCIYAAGVSNSNCIDPHEFARERKRIEAALQETMHFDAFVYFGTCSVADASARNTPYVQHKLAMEQLVHTHPRYLVLRLPQVAGRTPNPHTLLNYLYARISRSESFTLWSKAKRNIIDVDDVASIARQFILDYPVRNTTLNIANIDNYSMVDIISVMEHVVGKRAIYEIADQGSEYIIDISTILPVLEKAGVQFGNDYLERVVSKYYGSFNSEVHFCKRI